MILQGHVEFNVDCSPGAAVPHGVVHLGDHHRWLATIYPAGVEENGGEFVSLFVENLTKSNNGTAILDATVLRDDASECFIAASGNRIEADPVKRGIWGWRDLVGVSRLRQERRRFKVVCLVAVVVVFSQHRDPPRSFAVAIAGGGAPDIVFIVEDKTFTAHRAILAARSAVFETMLTGDTTPTTAIAIEDMKSWTFGAMRYFLYTDELPESAEFADVEPPGDIKLMSYESPLDFRFGDSMMQRLLDLLAAADRFAIDGLKLASADRLIGDITSETVSEMLVYAELYG
uniref:BTB domain-containing protein n=1 Tax=Leersia perrieri TaxID=77586 RepID=A0A0D9X9Y4_9ORYZ